MGAEPYIPIFLIVGGSFSVFKYLIGVLSRVRRAETGADQDPQPTHPVQSLITFFLCGWFITGCVWVYRIYWPETNIQLPGTFHQLHLLLQHRLGLTEA